MSTSKTLINSCRLTVEDDLILAEAVAQGKAVTKSDALRTALREYRIRHKISVALV